MNSIVEICHDSTAVSHDIPTISNPTVTLSADVNKSNTLQNPRQSGSHDLHHLNLWLIQVP